MGENQLDSNYIHGWFFKIKIQRLDIEWKLKDFQKVLLHNEFSLRNENSKLGNVLNGTNIKVMWKNWSNWKLLRQNKMNTILVPQNQHAQPDVYIFPKIRTFLIYNRVKHNYKK